MSCDRIFLVLGLALVASVSALGAHIEITPASMKEHGLHVECRFEAKTIKEGDQLERLTGMLHVFVVFDADKGPKIRDIREVTVHRELLPKATLRLSEGRAGSFRDMNYHLRLADFVEPDKPDRNQPDAGQPLDEVNWREKIGALPFEFAEREATLEQPDARGSAVDPDRMQFFYVSSSDKRFQRPRLPSLFAVQKKELQDEPYSKLYLAAAAGELPVAQAESPFLVIGGLIPSGHPSPYNYRVLDATFDGKTIHCRLQFIYRPGPRLGAGIPTNAFFVVDMPPLPAGKYTIRFQVAQSYIEKSHQEVGDRLLQRDPNRDVLERTPYEANFTLEKAN